MKVDLKNLESAISEGHLKQGDWGGPGESCCLMSALAGYSEDECTSEGWPLWLTELFVYLFDAAPYDEYIEWGRSLAKAAHAANERGDDFEEIFRAIRMDSILPIALKAVGDGEESWRVACRESVQWSINNNGLKNPEAARAARAAEAAWASEAAEAAWAAKAARASEAAKAAGASEAAKAAWAAKAEIYLSTLKVLNGEENE